MDQKMQTIISKAKTNKLRGRMLIAFIVSLLTFGLFVYTTYLPIGNQHSRSLSQSLAVFSSTASSKTYNFNYTELIRPGGLSDSLQYLIVVISAPPYVERRNAVRETWVRELQATRDMNTKVVFVLGCTANSSLQAIVKEEAKRFDDILLFNFQDSYRNLSVKVVTMLGWASQFRPIFLIRVDDDTMINVARLRHELDRLRRRPSYPYIAGHKFGPLSPQRHKSSKWYLSKEEYPESVFPEFLAGCFYIMPGHVPARLYETALRTRPFYLDDAYVTGCVAVKAGVPRHHMKHISFAISGIKKECDIHTMLAVHYSTPVKMRRFSQILRSTVRECVGAVCSCAPIP